MNTERIDLVCIFDFELDVRGAAAGKLLASIASETNQASLRAAESFDWLFYRTQSRINSAEDSSAGEMPALPGFRRVALKVPPEVKDVPGEPMGALVSVCDDLGVGSFIYWSRVRGNHDPLDLKLGLSLFLPPEYQEQMEELASHMTELERLYPFISIMSSSDSLEEVLDSEAMMLGQVFTGGLEHKAESSLRSFVLANLSERDYECFLARWTDGLAVYPRIGEELYELSMWRLAQLYELAILGRRALRTYVNENDAIAKTYRLLPRFIGIEQRRDRLLQTRALLIKGLPIQSDESRVLIERVSECFHLSGLEEDAKRSFEFLEGRFQFAKATFLGGLAVLIFLVTKINDLRVWGHFLMRHLGFR